MLSPGILLLGFPGLSRVRGNGTGRWKGRPTSSMFCQPDPPGGTGQGDLPGTLQGLRMPPHAFPLSASSSCGHQASKLLGAPRPPCPTPLALQSTGTLREDGDGKGGGEEVCTEEDDQSATAPGLPINSRGTSELSSVMVAHWARGDPRSHSDSRPRALPQTL